MKHFTISELTQSVTATRNGIDNTPPFGVVDNLTALVDRVLDPIRERWGRPIYVNSGYRSDALNTAVGGSKTSQHRTGEAADITAGSQADNVKLFALIMGMQTKGEITFDQLIDEKGLTWIHISYKRNGANRCQILKIG